MSAPLTFLCISCEYKGVDFLKYCKAEGNRVFLVTGDDERNQNWPVDILDDIFYIKADTHCIWNEQDLMAGMAHFMRHQKIDRVIALDDFDVERTALLREEFRIPGMGQTTARYFRDKLAMRMKAREAGIPVPPFTPLINDGDIKAYLDSHEPPFVLKPRAEASATGIKKFTDRDQLWSTLESLGPKRHRYLIEQFKPGDVYHVDAISSHGKVVFSRASKYMSTPFEVAHGGGVFRSHMVEHHGEEDIALRELNARVLRSFGMQHSASHSEYIFAKEEQQWYFLETSSRVGGANLAEMVEMGSGINLWGEWARLESATAKGEVYQLPQTRRDYAGIIMSLSKYEQADYRLFSDPEVVWTTDKPYHVGLIVRSDEHARVVELLEKYAEIIGREYTATAPPKDVTHE